MSYSNRSSSSGGPRQPRPTLNKDWCKLNLDQSIHLKQRRIEDLEASVHPGNKQYEKPAISFTTESIYEGPWNCIGFSGRGTYVYPHGPIYTGTFKDGEFHGLGVISYPMGHKVKGLWKNGKLVSKCFYFPDGLKATDPWYYCKIPDRRFQIEFNTSLNSAGSEFLTNRQPTINLPEGCYDTINGFYDPEANCIYNYDEEGLKENDPTKHIRCGDTLKRPVLSEESSFIKANYRKSSIETVGFAPELYEYWTTGREEEISKAIFKLHLPDKTADSCQMSVESGSIPSESLLNIEEKK
ncbi:MORN repeat-containing protein 5-like [Sitophilus oryzae]|uniref:MORN repeat-containing protein 5 n=1 Tax=Sitophilus oryzae TaxID=7048 RepID=A0A6J2XVB2_SITOR|nr:MORN repeat-containing protein 5-like [Sitophilus oryzae]